MKSIQITINTRVIAYGLGALFILYLFFAFLPIPKPINLGLDPSWKYGISQFSENGAIFGRDVIFTYGFFGYLVRGAVIEGNFWEIFFFRLLVHLTLIGLTLWRVVKSRNLIEQLAVSLSVIFPYLISDFYQALQTEYQILYIILLTLSFREFWQGKSARYLAIGIGSVGGFLLHSKVSLGLQASVSLFLFFAVLVAWGLLQREAVQRNLQLLLDSQLAAGTTAFLFLSPENLLNFGKIAILLSATVLLGGWLLPKLRPQAVNLQQFAPRLFYGISLLTLILTSQPSLLNYIKGYSEITSGYSSAMSHVGSPLELTVALIEILAVLALLLLTARDGNPGFSAAMLLVVLLTFKHGFVRQGAHVIRFFFSMPLVLALCAVQIRPGFWRKVAYVAHLYGLVAAMFAYSHYANLYAAYYPQNVVRPLNPELVATKARYFFNPQALKVELWEQSQDNLEGVTLPRDIRQVLGEASVDVIPWETSLVPANQLNWKPRPIFQSQAAYRPYLDFANRDSLANDPRDILLYNFHAVDQRHPFFDAPATAFHYTCHYQISPRVPAFVQLPKLANLMVLEPLEQSRCGEANQERELSVVWDEWGRLEAEDGDLVRAAIAFEYSPLGKLAKSFFRVPPVKMTVRDMGGNERTYRILTGNATDGVWLSHLPQDDAEAFAFFQGQLPQRVYSFKFSTLYPSLFQPRIRVMLTGHGLGDFQEPQVGG